jgi:hypothetical protein
MRSVGPVGLSISDEASGSAPSLNNGVFDEPPLRARIGRSLAGRRDRVKINGKMLRHTGMRASFRPTTTTPAISPPIGTRRDL